MAKYLQSNDSEALPPKFEIYLKWNQRKAYEIVHNKVRKIRHLKENQRIMKEGKKNNESQMEKS